MQNSQCDKVVPNEEAHVNLGTLHGEHVFYSDNLKEQAEWSLAPH